MLKKVFLIIFLFIFLNIFYLSFGNISARAETETEKFLNTLIPDLPDAIVSCRTGGVLDGLILRTPEFKSGGNTFFVDETTHKIAVFETAEVINTNDNNKEITVSFYIQADDVSKERVRDLLLLHNLGVENNAQVQYFIKIKTNEGTKTYVFQGKDDAGNPIYSQLQIYVRKLGTVISKKGNGGKFITIDGRARLKIPIPPKLVVLGPDGKSILVDDPSFDNSSSSIIECTFRRTPFHRYDLTHLIEAYQDEVLAKEIQKAADLGLHVGQ